MPHAQIRAYLEDGPRSGTTLSVDPGPDGQPPSQLVLADPPEAGGRPEESFDIETTAPPGATTYHLRGLDEVANVYVYGTD